MLGIEKIDHVGIRVRTKERAVAFYQQLGFAVVAEGVFEKGQPIIMEHPGGVVINLLGPASVGDGSNILMCIETKHAGYTHMALRVRSLEQTKAFLQQHQIPITGTLAFQNLRAIFIRDPDRNVIELDEYPGDEPQTRQPSTLDRYDDHP